MFWLTSPSMNLLVKEVLFLLLLCELREVFSVRGLFYVKCTLPLTRRTDNFVVIMAFNHPWLAMFYTHLLMLWASHIGCTWIESCVVVFAVLRLSRSFRVTLRRAWHFRLTFGICDHVTFELDGVNGVNRLATKGEKYYWLPTKRVKNYRLPTGKILTDYRHGLTLSIFVFRKKSILHFFLAVRKKPL